MAKTKREVDLEQALLYAKKRLAYNVCRNGYCVEEVASVFDGHPSKNNGMCDRCYAASRHKTCQTVSPLKRTVDTQTIMTFVEG